MGLSKNDILRLGPDAQRQIAAALTSDKLKPAARKNAVKLTDDFDSQLERDYYTREIWPQILTGEIVKCELHKVFELYPATEYHGRKLTRHVFKPDFVIKHRDGSIEVVEVKSKYVRKKERDYALRRRMFIEIYCRPHNWQYTDIIGKDNDYERITRRSK